MVLEKIIAWYTVKKWNGDTITETKIYTILIIKIHVSPLLT